MPPVTSMRVPASLERLEPVRQILSGAARALGFDDAAIAQLELALEEVLVNVCTHAYAGGEGEVEIAWAATGEELRLEIVDWGVAFDPTAAPDPARPTELDAQPMGGLGLYLVKQSMDEVRYRREDDRNHLTLVKRRSGRT